MVFECKVQTRTIFSGGIGKVEVVLGKGIRVDQILQEGGMLVLES